MPRPCPSFEFRRLLPAALVSVLLLVPVTFSSDAVTPGLQQALVEIGSEDFVSIVVMMEEFPGTEKRLAEVRGLNREARRHHVVTSMQSLARRSQKELRAVLAEDVAGSRNARVLWGINGIALEAQPSVIDRIATLPGVLRVQLDGGGGRPASGESTGEPALTGPTGGDASGPNPQASVRGEITAMGAEQVWNQLGYTGVGTIVAVLDTGVDPNHPDLADHIWTNLGEVPGNSIDDDGNGFVDDTWGWDFCDDDNYPFAGNHGTQAAGQVAGDGTNGVVTGMAPDAELMVLGFGTGCYVSDAMGWAASDYAIAMGAHIITESFIWPWDTSDMPDFEGWRRQTETELAAGVIHVNANGNDGENANRVVPYEAGAPANSPPPWHHPDQLITGALSSVIAVGNISWSSDTIAPSSSRGPSAWEDIVAHTWAGYPHTLSPSLFDYPYENGAQMGLIRPDVSAYGNGTTTTCPGTGYCSFSGTSSATPHVAGALALMLQANPEATTAELAEAIMTTAQHRGDPGKNNVYGTGLIQAFQAVQAVESTLVYDSHTIDDSTAGNGDLALDPGETVTMVLTVESRTDTDVNGLVAILSSATPGVTIHDHVATFPTVPARGTMQSDAPHFSLTLDPSACTTVITFDLEVRYQGSVRRSTFSQRVGDTQQVVLLADDFESDLGWIADPGPTTRGAWVREDPIGVTTGTGTPTNPEDDTSDPGVTCWVTGNGELNGPKNEDNNDVDDGATTLVSPPFGRLHMLSLDLTYDRWYYDNSGGGDFLDTEVSVDGGQNWLMVEHLVVSTGGWASNSVDLFAMLTPSDDMRLRFTAQDGSTDTTVEAAVDEVVVQGTWVECQDHTPPVQLAPNPVGDTLRLDTDAGGHAALSWQAPPVDAGHDPATLYRVERSTSPQGPWVEVGSATSTGWMDIDALSVGESFYYRVRAENSGGSE